MKTETGILRKNTILIKATFFRDDIKLKKTFDIVLETNYLKHRLKRYEGFCNGNPSFHRQQLIPTRNRLIKPIWRYDHIIMLIDFYICGFPEFIEALNTNPDGGFKMVMKVDLSKYENASVICVENDQLNKTDKDFLRVLDAEKIDYDMSLKSKFQMFTNEEKRVLRKLVLLNSKHERLYYLPFFRFSNLFENDLNELNLALKTIIKLKLLGYGRLISTDSEDTEELILDFHNPEVYEYFNIPKGDRRFYYNVFDSVKHYS